MKVIISGSRNVTDEARVIAQIEVSELRSSISEVVYGGAAGVETIAWKWAERNGIRVTRFEADWLRNPHTAASVRNEKMGDYADALLLIWDGKSHGSTSLKQGMMRRGKVVVERIIHP